MLSSPKYFLFECILLRVDCLSSDIKSVCGYFQGYLVLTPQREAVNIVFFPLLFHLTPLKWNFLWNWLTFLVTLVCGLSFYERMTFVEQATGDRNSIELGGKSTQTHRKDQMKNNALKWINTKRITSSAAVYMPWMPNKRFAVVFRPDI